MKKVTSADICKLAGVSQSTVSFVLNNRTDISISAETRAKVINAAKQLKYGPFAKNTNSVSNNIVAIFIPSLENPYYSMLTMQIEQELYQKQLKMLLCCTNGNAKKEEALLASIHTNNIENIIFTYTPQAADAITNLAKHKKIFIIGEVDYPIHANIITLNSRRAGYIAIQHLYEYGHKNIAFISNDINSVSLSKKNRLDGILSFAEEAGIRDRITVLVNSSNSISNNEIECGYSLTKQLLSQKKNISAIIGANDYTAVGIMNALYEAKLSIPDDISVIGFDNIPISNLFNPKLTTIDHILSERVRNTISLLTDNNLTVQHIHITYDPILLVRNSTKKI